MSMGMARAVCSHTPNEHTALKSFWFGVAISALIWAGLATGTTVTINWAPYEAQPQAAKAR